MRGYIPKPIGNEWSNSQAYKHAQGLSIFQCGTLTHFIFFSNSNIKLLNDVQYVPGLAHNLLSVGQLLNAGYFLLFDDGCCSVYDKKSSLSIVRIPWHRTKCLL